MVSRDGFLCISGSYCGFVFLRGKKSVMKGVCQVARVHGRVNASYGENKGFRVGSSPSCRFHAAVMPPTDETNGFWIGPSTSSGFMQQLCFLLMKQTVSG